MSLKAYSNSAPHIGTPSRPALAEETSLDPQNWSEFRRIAHGMLDEALSLVEGVRERPVWQPVPEAIKATLAEPMPAEPQGIERVCEDASRLVLPYTTGNIHPRFFGWVHGTGTAGGVIADMLAAAMNANVGGRDHGAVYVERQVIEWCRQLFGFPDGASGLLVSGTSMATLIALTVARNHVANTYGSNSAPGLETYDVRRHGLRSLPQLVAYTSSEAHGSVGKALEMLGLGRDHLRAVPVDAQLRMNPAALAQAIATDRAAGMLPFAVIATAGTVNTGALDPIPAIADICATSGIWLHVDGAFGAMAQLSEDLKHRVAGIERADSLAFDFHKWLHVPYDAGCVLVRDGKLHQQAFSTRPAYLAGTERGLSAGEPWFCEFGTELSRGFRALKVWFTLKEHGLRRLGEQVKQNCEQAEYLARRVAANPALELMAPVSLNIVCFRIAAPGVSGADLDKLNGDIVVSLQERGIAAPSTTKLGGRLAIRVNITNHRTTRADLDLMLDAILELAADTAFVRTAAAAVAPTPGEIAALSWPEAETCASTLADLLALPELKLLAEGVALTLDETLEVPFLVAEPARIFLGTAGLVSRSAGRVLLRHALEVAVWQRAIPDEPSPSRAAAIALLACQSAAAYLSTLPLAEQTAALTALPDWLASAYRTPAAPADWSSLATLLGPRPERLALLLEMQGADRDTIHAAGASPAVKADALNLVARLSELAAPAEALLVRGGDQRIRLVAETGRNSYGSSPRPEPGEVSLASSTATSISTRSYGAVEGLRQRLIRHAHSSDLPAAFGQAIEEVRARVLIETTAAEVPGVEAILTASGTDAELSTLHFALACDNRPLTSILISPEETGSGTPKAAAGQHFATETAQGGKVVPGAAIDGLADGRVRVVSIALRDASGAVRCAEAIASEVETLIERAVGAGARCLLHVLDASKTGLGAPPLGVVMSLMQRFAGELDVVVDACQMRLAPASVKAYLAAGCMVQITGSKFFTGAPFSGALLVPAAIAARRGRLARGFADYAARAEWPITLESETFALPQGCNLGLLARWTAALEEMQAFRSVPQASAYELLGEFAARVRDMIAERPDLALIDAPPFDRSGLAVSDAWSALQTILPFTLLRSEPDGTRRPMTLEEARQVHRLLAIDLTTHVSGDFGETELRLASQPCLIGQPVKIGEVGGRCIAALRICSSARLVSDAWARAAGGGSVGERLVPALGEAQIVLDKAELILAHWPTLGHGSGHPHR